MSRLTFKSPWICILFYLATIPATCSNNKTDFESLVAFKNAIDADPQGALSSWNETVHFCRWQGVFCGRKHPDRVVAIDLVSRGLVGTISPHLGNMSFLQSITLENNRFYGPIPESLIQLQSLKFLNLGFNNLTGRVPHGLFNISTIHTFEVSSNQLQGTLPSQMGFSLSSFTWLGLCENQFSGEIPIFLSNFSSLKYICLLANNFSGRVMLDFPRLSALEDFLVSDNNLKDDLSFISSMTNCTRLSTLEIADNQLYGSLPYSIANLSNDNLFLLDLSENQFHGTIPYGIGNLLNLGYLIIYDNDLTGPIPSSIGKLNKLQSLELRQNRLTHNIPLLLENLTLLSELDLSQNNLSGYIPPRLSNLLSLDLSHNNLNGGIPQEIMKMSSTFVYIDLSHNTLTGSIPAEVGLLINLGTLILSHNRLSGLLPDSLGNCVSLEYISMRSNFFSGEIPGVLRNLMSVYYLDLSQNNLSGAIPSFLGELNLLYMNLSFNKLKGEIPNAGVFLNETAVSLEGNTELCGGIQSLRFPPCTFQKSKKKHFPTIFQILIPVISIVSLVSLLYCTFWYKGRKSNHTQSCLVPVLETGHLRLTYGDLLRSTGGFSELNLLGTGRFGSVYKGILENLDTTVAIKVFNINVKGAAKSLMSECSALRGIRHRNLVKIVSVCSSIDFQRNDFKAIVYEYMINGDLDKWLHRNSDDESRTISLRLRVNIAIDIASGLEYLHCSTDSTIVHGDLKPSNILLDENMTAKVADFGLAKVISNRLSTTESNSIGIRGTIGYIPPEYGLSGIVSMEGDVYSFGIILLEMFTGRRPTNDEPNESPSLRDLVRSALPSQVMDIVDPVILQDHNHSVTAKTMNCIVSVLKIGLACSNESPRDRMLMTNVVHELRKTVLVA